jgi:hypothetical protein
LLPFLPGLHTKLDVVGWCIFWKIESEEIRKNGPKKQEKGLLENDGAQSTEVPLLEPQESCKLRIPWRKLGILLIVWLSFFSIYLLCSTEYGHVKLLSSFLMINHSDCSLLLSYSMQTIQFFFTN